MSTSVPTVGNPLRLRLNDLTDEDGNPITAATVIFVLLDPNGDAVTVGTVQHDSDTDDWWADATPLIAGTYTIQISGTVTGTGEDFALPDRLVKVFAATAAILAVGGTSLLDLVRRLSYRLGDIIVATATSNGTVNQFNDEIRLRRADNAYRSWEAYCAAATDPDNEGESRFVQGSSQSGGVLTVQPAMPAAFVTGDVVELHGSAGVGWTRPEKIAAINDAIAQAATMGGVETVATAAAAFDRDSPQVTVPSNLRFVHAIERSGSDGEWRTIARAKGRGSPGWWANKATGEIELLGGDRDAADGYAVRFWGHGEHELMSNDWDATLVNATWIIPAAAFYLITGYGQDRNPDKARSMQADLRQEMQIWRRAATRVRPPTSVGVR